MSLQTKVKILVGLIVIAIGCFFWAFYWSGKAEQAVQDNPPATKKEVARWKTAVVDFKAKAQVARRVEDSAVVAATVHEARADKSQHQVDSLTHVYETLPATTARATDTELYQHLLRYRPSAFPDTAAN